MFTYFRESKAPDEQRKWKTQLLSMVHLTTKFSSKQIIQMIITILFKLTFNLEMIRSLLVSGKFMEKKKQLIALFFVIMLLVVNLFFFNSMHYNNGREELLMACSVWYYDWTFTDKTFQRQMDADKTFSMKRSHWIFRFRVMNVSLATIHRWTFCHETVQNNFHVYLREIKN